MNKLYSAVKKTNPQDSLKRTNMKYAAVDVEDSKDAYRFPKTRPIVKYEDKIYRDPHYLIWQPLHSTNQTQI